MKNSKEVNRAELLHVSEIPLFRSLPAEELPPLLERYKTWDAPVGTLVLREGESGDEFYVILYGQVAIVRALGSAEESILGLRKPGEFIGEIGLLTQGAPCTATARVVEDARLLIIMYADFNALFKLHPELAYEMARVLSARITEALNETIRNVHDKNEKLQQAYDDLKAAQAKIIEKEKLEQSLRVAREIQYSILPTRIPRVDGYDIGALIKPAQEEGTGLVLGRLGRHRWQSRRSWANLNHWSYSFVNVRRKTEKEKDQLIHSGQNSCSAWHFTTYFAFCTTN